MIAKSYFEQLVPAFRDCEDEIFASIEFYLENVAQHICDEFSLTQEQIDSEAARQHLAPRFKAYLCKRTAYEALPHLDLILTSNGFAVANNQNLTPASRQRVYDLRERLRREKSDARDALLALLVENGDVQPDTLLYTPTLLRRYGVRTKDGAPVYEEELQLVLPDLYGAQHLAETVVGQEQMSELLIGQATFVEDSAESLLVQRCRRLMATYLKGADLRLVKHEVQDFLNRYADDLPTYKFSSKYEADHFTPYENKQDDSCFFFS
ncbi:MAG: hypothetical protein IKO20_05085 [Bacteroidaceae bacterium]|nr:hypothetical protein [Bacteroidaceae bacterium]